MEFLSNAAKQWNASQFYTNYYSFANTKSCNNNRFGGDYWIWVLVYWVCGRKCATKHGRWTIETDERATECENFVFRLLDTLDGVLCAHIFRVTPKAKARICVVQFVKLYDVAHSAFGWAVGWASSSILNIRYILIYVLYILMYWRNIGFLLATMIHAARRILFCSFLRTVLRRWNEPTKPQPSRRAFALGACGIWIATISSVQLVRAECPSYSNRAIPSSCFSQSV